jgi:hypothetical protein
MVTVSVALCAAIPGTGGAMPYGADHMTRLHRPASPPPLGHAAPQICAVPPMAAMPCCQHTRQDLAAHLDVVAAVAYGSADVGQHVQPVLHRQRQALDGDTRLVHVVCGCSMCQHVSTQCVSMGQHGSALSHCHTPPPLLHCHTATLLHCCPPALHSPAPLHPPESLSSSFSMWAFSLRNWRIL